MANHIGGDIEIEITKAMPIVVKRTKDYRRDSRKSMNYAVNQ